MLCPEPHLLYHVSGRLGLRTAEGAVLEAGPGEITSLPANHDAWVIGDEPAVVVDFFGVMPEATAGEALDR